MNRKNYSYRMQQMCDILDMLVKGGCPFQERWVLVGAFLDASHDHAKRELAR